jgi:hypothetical protein
MACRLATGPARGRYLGAAPASFSTGSSSERGQLTTKAANLLLSSERGAGGAVVSKEEVAAGRKGSGGAWGSISRNVGLGGPAPQNGRIRTLAKKKSQNVDRWAVGCNLVVLKMTCSQSGCKVQTHSSASPARAT